MIDLDWNFQGVNRLFVLSFENNTDRTREQDIHILSARYYLQKLSPKVEIKDYHVMIDGWKFLDQVVRNDMRTQENIWKTANDQGDDYTTVCLLTWLSLFQRKLQIDNYRIK